MRLVVILALCGTSLVWSGTALAVPPTITSVSQQTRHPIVTFSAPKSDHVVIEIASKPERGSDGSFFSENQVEFDLMTDSEVAAGRWLSESQIDPGTYYVLVRASPDFNLCYQNGGFDPSCADGYSAMATLVVPRPAVKYVVGATRQSYSAAVTLSISATPLGEKLPYRVCYLTKALKRLCLRDMLAGYSWNSGASERLTVSTRLLATYTTFSWFVGTRVIGSKRIRVR
ncbi:MAG: hypothetical protein ABIR67_00635 [Gaiellaceae bacterium]